MLREPPNFERETLQLSLHLDCSLLVNGQRQLPELDRRFPKFCVTGLGLVWFSTFSFTGGQWLLPNLATLLLLVHPPMLMPSVTGRPKIRLDFPLHTRAHFLSSFLVRD